MHDVLAALEAFQEKALGIFDKVERACGEVDANLNGLNDRLDRAAAQVEASRGSTRALKVYSAKEMRAPRSTQRTQRLFDSDTLAALSSAAPLPEDFGAGNFRPLTAASSARVLTTVVKCIQAPMPLSDVQSVRMQSASNKLLAAQDRLSSVTELLLFNSAELMYKDKAGTGQRFVDNLTMPDEVEVQQASMLMPWQKRVQSGEPNLHYDEDAQDPLMVDLRFAPKPAQRVKFALPEQLVGLRGTVADMAWREENQLETETQRPEWDQSQTLSRSRKGTRAGSTIATPQSKNRRDTATDLAAAARQLESKATTSPTTKATPAAPPPPKKEQAKPPSPVKAPPKTPEQATPANDTAAPPVPKGKGKGKDKGKGKGKGSPPPPPKPKKGAPPAPPAAKGGKAPPAPAPAASKAAMLGDIRAGAKLKKVKTVEKTGAPVGRVV